MALPVKIANCFGVLDFMKSQAPSTKLQTNLKFQYQMTKTGLEFSITPADCRKGERPLKPP
jgi:hypothetical protein